MTGPPARRDGIAHYVTTITSTSIRLFSYVFLRWIPGSNLPILILSLLAVYIAFFIHELTNTAQYEVIADELEIIETEVDPSTDAVEIDPALIQCQAEPAPLRELDVQETVVLRERNPRRIRTLFSGSPGPNLLWNSLTLGMNLLLVGMVVDLAWSARYFHPADDLSFARVGYVSQDTAKVLVREPDPNRLPISIAFQATTGKSTAWKVSRETGLFDNSTDFTNTFTLAGLKSDTRYRWESSNNHSGEFFTAPQVGSTSNRVGAAGSFTFVHSSCLKNRFPYQPFVHPLSNPGLKYLSQALTGLGAQFMLFIGDFIYADVPLRHGTSAEDFRREYRQIYASPDWPGASQTLPWIHVYDDHEVANDWSSNTTGIFPAADDPYQHYHVSANPPPARAGTTYFAFTQGPVSFFVLDTRRYRSPNDHTNGSDPVTGDATKTMLGNEQLTDVLAWLRKTDPPGVRWKVLVSSIPFTKNWWFGAQDTWRGYLGERQVLLEAMWDVGLHGGTGVIILSGDRHEFAATAFPPPPDGKEELIGLGAAGVGAYGMQPRVIPQPYQKPLTRRKMWPLSATVHEFSASPLSMFYLPVRTYTQSSTSPDYVSDALVKYIPDGNSKFGSVSVSSPPTSDQSVLTYRLFVDGVENWRHTLTTPPIGNAKEAIWG